LLIVELKALGSPFNNQNSTIFFACFLGSGQFKSRVSVILNARLFYYRKISSLKTESRRHREHPRRPRRALFENFKNLKP
jgi:hypothetical protein